MRGKRGSGQGAASGLKKRISEGKSSDAEHWGFKKSSPFKGKEDQGRQTAGTATLKAERKKEEVVVANIPGETWSG